MWSVPTSSVSHVTREEPLQPKRIPSVFDNSTDNKAEPMGIDELEGSVHADVKKVSFLYDHVYTCITTKNNVCFFSLYHYIIMYYNTLLAFSLEIFPEEINTKVNCFRC